MGHNYCLQFSLSVYIINICPFFLILAPTIKGCKVIKIHIFSESWTLKWRCRCFTSHHRNLQVLSNHRDSNSRRLNFLFRFPAPADHRTGHPQLLASDPIGPLRDFRKWRAHHRCPTRCSDKSNSHLPLGDLRETLVTETQEPIGVPPVWTFHPAHLHCRRSWQLLILLDDNCLCRYCNCQMMPLRHCQQNSALAFWSWRNKSTPIQNNIPTKNVFLSVLMFFSVVQEINSRNSSSIWSINRLLQSYKTKQ